MWLKSDWYQSCILFVSARSVGVAKKLIFLDFEPLPWKAAFDFSIWQLQALISYNPSPLWWNFLTALSRNFWSQLQERRLARQIWSLENLFHRNKLTKNPPFCILPRIANFSKCQKISLSQIKKWVGPLLPKNGLFSKSLNKIGAFFHWMSKIYSLQFNLQP